jgi:crossover junction endodeoxyribonuclease RuvC
MPTIALGVDPGFASFGWCALAVSAPAQLQPVGAGVIRTKKASARARTYASDDNLARAREIYRALDALVRMYAPQVLCAEAMSFPRNASAAAKVAISWGVLAAVAEARQLPLLQASPQAVKKAVCGVNDASKEQVQAAFRERVRDLGDLLGGVPAGQHEHPYDAGAVVLACLDSDVMRLLVR